LQEVISSNDVSNRLIIHTFRLLLIDLTLENRFYSQFLRSVINAVFKSLVQQRGVFVFAVWVKGNQIFEWVDY
jgi:hypothetical protein